jgi:hypothetical protein
MKWDARDQPAAIPVTIDRHALDRMPERRDSVDMPSTSWRVHILRRMKTALKFVRGDGFSPELQARGCRTMASTELLAAIMALLLDVSEWQRPTIAKMVVTVRLAGV